MKWIKKEDWEFEKKLTEQKMTESSNGGKPPKSMMRDELHGVTLEDWEAARIKYIKPTKEELKKFIMGAAEFDGSSSEYFAQYPFTPDEAFKKKEGE